MHFLVFLYLVLVIIYCYILKKAAEIEWTLDSEFPDLIEEGNEEFRRDCFQFGKIVSLRGENDKGTDTHTFAERVCGIRKKKKSKEKEAKWNRDFPYLHFPSPLSFTCSTFFFFFLLFFKM